MLVLDAHFSNHGQIGADMGGAFGIDGSIPLDMIHLEPLLVHRPNELGDGEGLDFQKRIFSEDFFHVGFGGAQAGEGGEVGLFVHD